MNKLLLIVKARIRERRWTLFLGCAIAIFGFSMSLYSNFSQGARAGLSDAVFSVVGLVISFVLVWVVFIFSKPE